MDVLAFFVGMCRCLIFSLEIYFLIDILEIYFIPYLFKKEINKVGSLILRAKRNITAIF